jgi:hypothetical protein
MPVNITNKHAGSVQYFLLLIAASPILFFLGCKKTGDKTAPPNLYPERTVIFKLSSEGDFSQSIDSIFFSMRIEKINPLVVTWDSALHPMQLRELPKTSNSFQYIKKIDPSDTGFRRFGFLYTIKNVGQYWKYDSIGKNELSKTIHLVFK